MELGLNILKVKLCSVGQQKVNSSVVVMYVQWSKKAIVQPTTMQLQVPNASPSSPSQTNTIFEFYELFKMERMYQIQKYNHEFEPFSNM